jgi:hypothetical protein
MPGRTGLKARATYLGVEPAKRYTTAISNRAAPTGAALCV